MNNEVTSVHRGLTSRLDLYKRITLAITNLLMKKQHCLLYCGRDRKIKENTEYILFLLINKNKVLKTFVRIVTRNFKKTVHKMLKIIDLLEINS